MQVFHHLHVAHRTVFVDDKLRHHLAFYLLLLGDGRIFEVFREPLHKLGRSAGELGQILHHAEIHRLVVHVDHLRLLLLGRRFRIGLFHGQLFCFRWQLHILIDQPQLLRFLLLHFLFLWQHHRYLVLFALQGRELHLRFQVVVIFKESPATVGAVPLQGHEEESQHNDQSQQKPLRPLSLQIGLTTLLDFHNKSVFSTLYR